jgi:hypothetical protein
MLSIIQNIPDVQVRPLKYVFEHMQIVHSSDKLWLEFGVGSGASINYISQFANGGVVYGFDSFQGLPEKWIDGYEAGSFTRHGSSPPVNPNVELVIDVYSNSLVPFLQSQNKKISFVHIDCVVYSSTKFVLDSIKPYLDDNCVIVFGAIVNYPGFDGETGELKAFYDFLTEHSVNCEWIGMKGSVGSSSGHESESVAVLLNPSGSIHFHIPEVVSEEVPVVEEPVLEEPVLEEPVLEEPVLEEPVLEEPEDEEESEDDEEYEDEEESESILEE